MDHLPQSVQHGLVQNTKAEVSAWVKNAIDSASKIEVFDHEKTLASKLVQYAYTSAEKTGHPVGYALAAAFDLFVAAEYYKNVAHKGWYYCPEGDPLLFYPYTNTCPRCVLQGNFHFEQANKPGSGSIGQATSRLLGIFLLELFAKKANRNLLVYRGVEPIDMIIYEQSTNTVLLSEIKAAPLQTLALAASSDKLTWAQEDGEIVPIKTHVSSDNTSLSSSEIFMCLPITQNSSTKYKLISLGSTNKISDASWAYKRIEQALDKDASIFDAYLKIWEEAFSVYKPGNTQRSNVYWLTNGCGQPNPRPRDWPSRRKGTGYESVSDGKTSVGMDRTDDIKKGIYQVLKVGAESKPQSKRSHFSVKTALISNLHAVRHYEEVSHISRRYSLDNRRKWAGQKSR